jgi:sulfotransferase famil protein
MEQFYSVALHNAGHLPTAADKKVVFHGVNKSGSLAMANVLRQSYQRASRTHQFLSHYHRSPSRLDELFESIRRNGGGHSLFIAHYLFRAPQIRNCKFTYVSQVRHPLVRTLSVHNWLKKNHRKRNNGDDGFPGLEEFVKQSKGRAHSQYSQFGIGFGKNRARLMSKLTNQQIFDRAIAAVEADFGWIGIAEYFEESIFAMCHLLGLPEVAPWQRDRRNEDRIALASLSPSTVALIEEVYQYEFRFYDYVKARFLSAVSRVDFGPAFAEYKHICTPEYRERII